MFIFFTANHAHERTIFLNLKGTQIGDQNRTAAYLKYGRAKSLKSSVCLIIALQSTLLRSPSWKSVSYEVDFAANNCDFDLEDNPDAFGRVFTPPLDVLGKGNERPYVGINSRNRVRTNGDARKRQFDAGIA